MDNWVQIGTFLGVAVVAIPLISFIVDRVAKPIMAVNKNLTELNLNLEYIKGVINDIKKDNDKDHEKFEKDLKSHNEKLIVHGKAIETLERITKI